MVIHTTLPDSCENLKCLKEEKIVYGVTLLLYYDKCIPVTSRFVQHWYQKHCTVQYIPQHVYAHIYVLQYSNSKYLAFMWYTS